MILKRNLEGPAFGQHKIEASICGTALAGFGLTAMYFGWLGLWGYALWIPMTLFGVLYALFVGHFLIILFPLFLVFALIDWWNSRHRD